MAIICELCGNTDFVKEDGMFVCKGCNTKYSLEEAKKMMGGSSSGESNEKKSEQIENLLVLANNAFDSSNNKEAEDCCNKILEMDVTCYKAWLIKGKAIGWQSTYGSPRVEEGANAMRKAVDFAPEEEKEDVASDAITAIMLICNALASLAKTNFGDNPTDDNRLKFGQFLTICRNSINSFLDISKATDCICDVCINTHKKNSGQLMNLAGVAAVKMVREKWNGIDYPNKNSLDTYINWFSEIKLIFMDSIQWGEDTKENESELITRYENRIIALEEPMEACSYKQEWSDWQSKYIWVIDFSLTDSAKASRRKEIKECEQAIESLKNKIKEKESEKKRAEEEERKKRIEEYWKAHKEEKEKLDAEMADLQGKIDENNKKIKEINDKNAPKINELNKEKSKKLPVDEEVDKQKAIISDLEYQRSECGLFKFKEKKALTERIENVEQPKLSDLKKKAEEERKKHEFDLSKKIQTLRDETKDLCRDVEKFKNRIGEIKAELNADR